MQVIHPMILGIMSLLTSMINVNGKKMCKKSVLFQIGKLTLVLLLLAACSQTPNTLPTATIAPTDTPAPTATPEAALTSSAANEQVQMILTRSKLAMEQVQSMRIAYTTTVEVAGLTVVTNGEGVFKQPGQMYLKLDALGQTIEFLVPEDGKTYIKMPGADTFTLNTPETGAQGNTAPDILAQMDVAQFANAFTYEGVESVDGTPTDVISFTMDIGKYLQKDPSSAALFDPAKTTGGGKIWIDQQTGYLLQMVMNLDMEIVDKKVATMTEMKFSGFNEQVEIPQP